MESLDSSFDKVKTAVNDSLQALRISLSQVHEKISAHDEKQRHFREGLKSIKEAATFAETRWTKKEEFETLKQQLKAVLTDVDVIKKQEIDEMESLQQEVIELKNQIDQVEKDLSKVKNKLDHVSMNVQRNLENRRSMRA